MNVGLDTAHGRTRSLDGGRRDLLSEADRRARSRGRPFDFLGGNFINVSAGEGALEPIQLAVRSVVERAVVEMMANLYGARAEGAWSAAIRSAAPPDLGRVLPRLRQPGPQQCLYPRDRRAGLAATLAMSCLRVATDRSRERAVHQRTDPARRLFSSQTPRRRRGARGRQASPRPPSATSSPPSASSAAWEIQSDQQVDGRVQAASDLTVSGPTGEFFVTDNRRHGQQRHRGNLLRHHLRLVVQTVSKGALVAATPSARPAASPIHLRRRDRRRQHPGVEPDQRHGRTWTEQRNLGVTSAQTTACSPAHRHIGLSATSIATTSPSTRRTPTRLAMKQDAEGAVSSVVTRRHRGGDGRAGYGDARQPRRRPPRAARRC